MPPRDLANWTYAIKIDRWEHHHPDGWAPARPSYEEEESMPLKKGPSQQALEQNIAELRKAGKPAKQAAAIAHDVQRKAGGPVKPPRKNGKA